MVNDDQMFHFSHCSSKNMNGATSPVVVVSPCGELRSLWLSFVEMVIIGPSAYHPPEGDESVAMDLQKELVGICGNLMIQWLGIWWFSDPRWFQMSHQDRSFWEAICLANVLWLDSYVGQSPLFGCRKAKVLKKNGYSKMIASAEI